MRRLLAVAAALSAATAGAQIREEPYAHLGVATCASSTCHGRLTPQESATVWLNEYRIWSTQDRHARAFQTLTSEQSRRIAANLGLPSAQTAQICLDCHADHVAPERRGPRFQLSDGVGCEACHGGAERWIESHTEPGVTHQDNVARGMYPTHDPVARAELCFSCHLGTRDQFATHMIMGAGHPRLRFELEAFTANQPAHYAVDEDYVARKGSIDGFNLWLTGQMQAATRYLTLIRTPLYTAGGGAFPELAFYDCHACHHSLHEQRWSRQHVPAGVDPGAPRLQSQHLLMLQAVTRTLEPNALDELRRAVATFVRAGQRGAPTVSEAAGALLSWIDARERRWAAASYERAQVQAIRRNILALAAAGELADFASAEQAFLSLESLTLYLGGTARQRSALDELFATVERDQIYQPARFASTAGRIAAEF